MIAEKKGKGDHGGYLSCENMKKRVTNVKKSHLEWRSYIGLTAPLKKDHQRYISDVTWTGKVGVEFLVVVVGGEEGY